MREKAQKVTVQVMFDVILVPSQRFDRRARDFEVFFQRGVSNRSLLQVLPDPIAFVSKRCMVRSGSRVAVSMGRNDRPIIRKARFGM